MTDKIYYESVFNMQWYEIEKATKKYQKETVLDLNPDDIKDMGDYEVIPCEKCGSSTLHNVFADHLCCLSCKSLNYSMDHENRVVDKLGHKDQVDISYRIKERILNRLETNRHLANRTPRFESPDGQRSTFKYFPDYV